MAKARPHLIALLSVLLLVSQYVAVSHALWHQTHGIPEHAATVGQPDHGHSHDDGGIGQLCAFDALLGQILAGGAVANPAPLPGVEPAGFIAGQTAALSALASVQPRSRGPPVFL